MGSWLGKWFSKDSAAAVEESELMRRVREALRDVEAYANSHGGSLQLISVSDEGDVVIKFKGACSSCPLSTITLKHGVEKALKDSIPEVRSVRAL